MFVQETKGQHHHHLKTINYSARDQGLAVMFCAQWPGSDVIISGHTEPLDETGTFWLHLKPFWSLCRPHITSEGFRKPHTQRWSLCVPHLGFREGFIKAEREHGEAPHAFPLRQGFTQPPPAFMKARAFIEARWEQVQWLCPLTGHPRPPSWVWGCGGHKSSNPTGQWLHLIEVSSPRLKPKDWLKSSPRMFYVCLDLGLSESYLGKARSN